MRFLGLILTSLVFFALLALASVILGLNDPRQTTMSLFYLSIPLTLILSYLFSAAGRAENLGISPSAEGWSTQAQSLGFPIGHRHAWGDFGRLYALVFLVFLAPVILAAFPTLIANNLVGFEQTVDISADGTGLSETEALQKIGSNEIPLNTADQARYDTVLRVAQMAYLIGLALILPCFAKLVPFYFWRSGGRSDLTLADAWRRVGWGPALTFGFILFGGLAASVLVPTPLLIRHLFAAGFIALWALLYAKRVGSYDPS